MRRASLLSAGRGSSAAYPTVSMLTGTTSSGRSNSRRTTSGSKWHTQHVPRPASCAAIIIWSHTMVASMSALTMPSYERRHASAGRTHTSSTSGAPNTLPSFAKFGAERAIFSRSAAEVATITREGCRLHALGASRPASRTASTFSCSTARFSYARTE